MDPPDDGSHGSSERHEIVVDAPEPTRLMDFIPIYIPTVEKGALSRSLRKRRFLDFLRARPSKDWFLRSTFVGRLRRRSQITSREEEEDHDDSDENYGECRLRRRGRFRVPFVRKIKWAKLCSSAARWCKRPANFAMIIWLAFVAAGLLLLFLLMTGMLDGAIPQDARRKDWTEVINQILNALFTIMCLYQHPTIFHHLVLLLRWRPDGDRDEVRKVYCKEGAPAEPHDRAHMLVVVALLHITCLAQYFCCALFWSYSRTDRPDWPLNIGYGVGTTFPVIAVIYMAYSPLGHKQHGTESSPGEEAHGVHSGENDGDVEIRVYNRSVVVGSPEWSGGVFDCCDDATVCALSATCTFCVFGWNMERLGFGNMCVHTFTFILLCVAPFLVFSATALNIHDHDIRLIVVVVGVLLGFFGFLYGGYWRMQMRKRYKLPATGGGGPGWAAVGDCAKWLFCWSCALAQEVRTANFYDVDDDRFVVHGARNEDGRAVLMPLPREASATYFRSISCPPKIDAMVAMSDGDMSSPVVQMGDIAMERSATYNGYGANLDRQHAMRPPLPTLIQMDRED
jgi:Cys-rich protein (TIGR01571 family)